ncbi:right-handed parallel beta-helix repeat-containing protein [Streptomyces chryseus]
MLPDSIPTVTVTGRFLAPDGTPLAGQVVWRAPALLTFADADVMLSGPVTARLDASGAFAVELPATDAAGMVPSGWAYVVTEQLTGVPSNRSYSVLLPQAAPVVDLADLAPTDPTTPNYVAVNGKSAYELATADGYTGTVTQWLASLVGPAGPPGSVNTVNGKTGPAVNLDAADVEAAPADHTHTAASVGASPTGHTHTAADVGAVPTTGGTVNGDLAITGRLTGGTLDLASARIFNVHAYGAVGNGIADDTAAIQAALNAARTAGGGVVLIPGGRTYAINTFLAVFDNTTIWAWGATVRSVGTTGLLRNFLDSELFNGYAGHSNILIAGGIWDANAADGTTGTVTGMTNAFGFVHAKNITARDVTIRNVSSAHALEFNSVDGGRVINCRFEGYRDNSGDSSRQFSEAVQIDIAVSGSSSIGNFDGTPSRNILVEGCYFGPSERCGVFGRAVGSHTAPAGKHYENVQVLGNRIEGTLREGIHGYSWRNAVIAKNIISGTGWSGILVGVPAAAVTSHAIKIANNAVSSSGTDSAIRVIGNATNIITSVSVIGNTARSITGNAFHVEYCKAPKITGNDCDTTSSNGIYANLSSDPTVSDNTVVNAGSNAVNISGCAGGSVTVNTVLGTATNHGLFIGPSGATASTDVLLQGNHVVAAASAGIRLSTNAARCTVTGNRVRKGSGATLNGITLSADATACVVAGNDLSGNGWTAATALSISTAAPKLDWAGGTASPGHNII